MSVRHVLEYARITLWVVESHMDPIVLIFLLLAAGAVLFVGELLLPTHGVLGIVGLVCLGLSIALVFTLNKWIGLAIFLAAMVASPFLLNLAMWIWAKSPVGKRIILQPIELSRAPAPIRIGQSGLAVTELRPMGECDFGDQRLEAVSQLGIIPAGAKVKVVAIDNGRPTVRACET